VPLCLLSMSNSFNVTGPCYAKERYPQDFVFVVRIMSIRLSEEEHAHLASVYTWVRLDRYALLKSASAT